MGITTEFARLGARLVNHQWAVSALTETELVVSLWFHRLKSEEGQLVYRDYLGRWSGHGNRLFAEHLKIALADQRPVRLVIVRTDDVEQIESGGDGSKVRKTFRARPEWVGRVTAFDGDQFAIGFDKAGLK